MHGQRKEGFGGSGQLEGNVVANLDQHIRSIANEPCVAWLAMRSPQDGERADHGRRRQLCRYAESGRLITFRLQTDFGQAWVALKEDAGVTFRARRQVLELRAARFDNLRSFRELCENVHARGWLAAHILGANLDQKSILLPVDGLHAECDFRRGLVTGDAFIKQDADGTRDDQQTEPAHDPLQSRDFRRCFLAAIAVSVRRRLHILNQKTRRGGTDRGRKSKHHRRHHEMLETRAIHAPESPLEVKTGEQSDGVTGHGVT